MVDAIGCLTRYGIEWRALPVDFPPWEAVYAFFERWSERGLPQRLVDRLRGRIRIACGRAELPTAGRLVTWAKAVLCLTLTVVKRTDDIKGFVVLPRRWVVERTFGWLTRHRRLVRDYERRPEHHEAMVWWATVTIMTRRLTRELSGDPPPARWGQPGQPSSTTA